MGCSSQQSPSALSGSTAAQQHLPLHTTHLIVVVPGQLCAGPDPSAQEHQQLGERAYQYVKLKSIQHIYW